MFPQTLRTIRLRILLLPALYVSYTLAIWLLPTRAPARVGTEPTAVGPQATERSRAGRRVWRENACQTCHSIYGLGGHLGPDLTNSARAGMGMYVRIVVREGRLAMPAFDLSDRELEDLIAWLQVVDASGLYPPRSLTEPVFGVSR